MIKREYGDYVKDILDAAEEIRDFTKGMDAGSFAKDKKTINAVVRSLEVMGEAAKKIPEKIREKYPQVPWKRMAGMRDILIHEYFGVDDQIVWTVATKEIPPLKPVFVRILDELSRQ